jgi:hypothetical protein
LKPYGVVEIILECVCDGSSGASYLSFNIKNDVSCKLDENVIAEKISNPSLSKVPSVNDVLNGIISIQDTASMLSSKSGFGIGIPITQNMLCCMDSCLDFKTTDSYCLFWFTILLNNSINPIAPSDAEIMIAADASSDADVANAKSKGCVLVVDDSSICRRIAVKYLSNLVIILDDT